MTLQNPFDNPHWTEHLQLFVTIVICDYLARPDTHLAIPLTSINAICGNNIQNVYNRLSGSWYSRIATPKCYYASTK